MQRLGRLSGHVAAAPAPEPAGSAGTRDVDEPGAAVGEPGAALGAPPTAAQHAALAKDGFVILRGIIAPHELPALRRAADSLLAHAGSLSQRPSCIQGGAVAVAGSSCLAELVASDRFYAFSCGLMRAEAALCDGTVAGAAGTGWHRDYHPFDMAPMNGIQAAIANSGPPYMQWNVALLPDQFFQVVVGSHCRPNTPAERVCNRAMGATVPLQGAMAVVLQPGDAIAYNNALLHSALPNDAHDQVEGSPPRRNMFLSYSGFGGASATTTLCVCAESLFMAPFHLGYY